MSTAGACLCGAVRFTGHGALTGVTPCHCGQCRGWCSGPFWASHFADGVSVEAGEALAWYASSERGERGFCARCGSTLFWRRPGEPRRWAVSAGALPDGAGQRVTAHIWVEDKPGWYGIAEEVPRLTAADFSQARAGRESTRKEPT